MNASHSPVATRKMILLLGCLVLLGLLRAYWSELLMLRGSQLQQVRQLAAAGDPRLAGMLDRSTVFIAAGEFKMGSNDGRSDERPQHAVFLDAYEIDRYEVTNLQYRRYLLAAGRAAPQYWTDKMYPAAQADYPVVGVSWDDANAYCQWAGKRLPTEAEWEKACRSADARLYPWGDAWDPGRANVDVSNLELRPVGHTESEPSVWDLAWQTLRETRTGPEQPGLQPIGSYPAGASPYGVMDMAGNASEWVADWYNWSDYSQMPARNPLGTDPPWNHCLRGSAWHDPAGDANWVQDMSRCSARSSAHADSDPRVGFRCAQSSP